MTDPVSIAAFATSAAFKSFKVVRALAVFKSQVSGIDQTVESLHYQVDGISVVLSALTDELKEPEFTSQTATLNQSLVRHLPKAIEQCDVTLTSVNERINKLNPPKKRNIAKQTWAAVKLQWSEPEINELLARIKGHSMNLQLALMTVSLHNSVHKKAVPTIEQNERFDKLEQMIVAIHDRLEQSASASGDPGGSLTSVPVDDCTTALAESAASVVSSASTFAGRSVSGVTNSPQNTAAFDYIYENVSTQQPKEGSTTGSELGPPQTPENLNHLASWIQQTSLSGSALRDTTPNPRSGPATNTFRSLNDSGVVLTNESQSQEEALSSDGEDDVDFVVATKLFRDAKRHTEAEDYKAGNAAFKDAFKLAKSFNTRKCQKLGLPEMKVLFACCKEELDEIEEAEKLFSEVAHLQMDDATSAAIILHAQFYLAYLKLSKGELQYAETLCRQMLKNVAKLPSMGKSHANYHSSLQQLSVITLAKGEPHQAKHYMELLPSSRRPEGIKELNYFSKHPNMRQVYPTMVMALSDFRQPYFLSWQPDAENEDEPPEGIERHIYIEGPAMLDPTISPEQGSDLGTNAPQPTNEHQPVVSTYAGNRGKPLKRKLRALFRMTDVETSSARSDQPTERKSSQSAAEQTSEAGATDTTSESKASTSLFAIKEKRHNFIRPSSQCFQSFAILYSLLPPSSWLYVVELTVTMYTGSKTENVRRIYKLQQNNPDAMIFLYISMLPTLGKTIQWRTKQVKDPLETSFSLTPERTPSPAPLPSQDRHDTIGWNVFTLQYDGTCTISKSRLMGMALNGKLVDVAEFEMGPQDRITAFAGIKEGLSFGISVKAAQIRLAGDGRRGYRIKAIRGVPSGPFSGPMGQIVPSELSPSKVAGATSDSGDHKDQIN